MIKFIKGLWTKLCNVFKRKKPAQVKPSGTTSVLKGTSDGVHPSFSTEYKRAVNRIETEGWQGAKPVVKPGVIRPLREVKTVDHTPLNSPVTQRVYAGYEDRRSSDSFLTDYLIIQALTPDDRNSDKVETVKERPQGDTEVTYSPSTRYEEEPVRECKPTPIYSSPSKSDVDECYTRSSSSSYDYGSSSSSDSYSSSDSGSSWD